MRRTYNKIPPCSCEVKRLRWSNDVVFLFCARWASEVPKLLNSSPTNYSALYYNVKIAPFGVQLRRCQIVRRNKLLGGPDCPSIYVPCERSLCTSCRRFGFAGGLVGIGWGSLGYANLPAATLRACFGVYLAFIGLVMSTRF